MKKIQIIINYLENQGISLSEFERKSDLGNGYLKKTMERGADVTNKILERIRQNNPDDYSKIFEILDNREIKKPSPDNGEDYKDKYIALLEQQLQDQGRQLSELKIRMDSRTLQITEQIDRLAANLKEHDQTARIALAYAKTLYLTLQGHMAKVEKAPLQRVQDDMDKTLVQQVKEVLSGNGN